MRERSNDLSRDDLEVSPQHTPVATYAIATVLAWLGLDNNHHYTSVYVSSQSYVTSVTYLIQAGVTPNTYYKGNDRKITYNYKVKLY